MVKNKNSSIDEKLDLILQEVKNCSEILAQHDNKLKSLSADIINLNEKVSGLENCYSSINEKVSGLENCYSSINEKVAGLENCYSSINEKVSSLENSYSNLDRRLISLKSDNLSEHAKIIKLLTSLNSAFLRYETEGLDKIKILFDADNDRRNHQDIYGHEFQRLNNLVAKNSFRISNLENH